MTHDSQHEHDENQDQEQEQSASAPAADRPGEGSPAGRVMVRAASACSRAGIQWSRSAMTSRSTGR